MEWIPEYHGLITRGMSDIIRYLFSTSFPFRIVLGGSCALSEFYLGHRKPNDIDIFLPVHPQAQEAADYLSREFKSSVVQDRQNDHTYYVPIATGNERIEVHCCVLHPRWNNSELQNHYLLNFEGIILPRFEYLAYEKLRALQSLNQDQLKRAVCLFDMKCMFEVGITADLLADVALWLGSRVPSFFPLATRTGINVESALCDLPESVHVGRVAHDLSQFGIEFTQTLRTAWRHRGL